MANPVPRAHDHHAWARLVHQARMTASGTAGALTTLALLLSLGLLAYAPLGANAASAGIAAMAVSVLVAGVVHAALGSGALPTGGPSTTMALLLAALVQAVGTGPGAVTDAPTVMALCGLSVALSGMLQMAGARLGLARLARLVPRPVLAGFMNGVALAIAWSQLPLLLGWAPGSRLLAAPSPPLHAGALGLALLTLAVVLVVERVRPRWPASLVALVAGALAYRAGLAHWPQADWGPAIGGVPEVWPQPTLLAALVGDAGLHALAQHGTDVLAMAAVLALLGTLESMLNVQAVDQLLQSRHDPQRELWSVGVSNVACGLLGGLPVVSQLARASAVIRAGGRGRLAAGIGPVVVVVVLAAGTGLVAQLPLPVMGTIVLLLSVGLVDRWSLRLLRVRWRGRAAADHRAALAVMLLVCGVTLWQGFAAGVTAGVLLSMAIFVARMNRSLLRTQCTAAEQPSRRLYAGEVEERLSRLRPQIGVWTLEGALFFGNADRLLHLAEQALPGLRALVLDLHRVTAVDETGAAALAQLGRMARRDGVLLSLAGVAPGSASARALQAEGLELAQHPDADRAIETAEQHLLGPTADATVAARPLFACDLFQGLSLAQQQLVHGAMTELRLFEGQALFRQGDAADGLYVLTLGSISVIGRDGSQSHRYLSISPGMMLGETALLDGGGRSADAVADSFCAVLHLSAAALQRLEADEPGLARQLYRNIAVHLSRRLRSVSALAWSRQR